MEETNNDPQLNQMLQGAQKRALEEYNSLPWYQKNLDVTIPSFIILVGILQVIVRRWIFPVPTRVVKKLEAQFPLQGFFYHPIFGMILIGVGVILLLVHFFSEFS